MERSTNIRKTPSVRRELESYVIGWNKFLKEAVQSMDFITLLRNANPVDRPDFTYKLLKEGLITIEEAKEFTKVITR
jgi:hypothetical protein